MRSLEVPGGALEVPKEVLGDPWGSLGRSLEVLGGPWGGPKGHQKRKLFSRSVLGWSWEGLGVFLEVLGDPWLSLERAKCCNFEFLDGFLRCHVF